MKKYIQKILSDSLTIVLAQAGVIKNPNIVINLEVCKNKEHGDYASNLAMLLSKVLKQNPREIADTIIQNIPKIEKIEKIVVAGPGFINFFVKNISQTNVINTILTKKSNFGTQQSKQPKSICIEFVSANPTGPLHVGHGRGAAFGDSLANLLRTLGHQVHSEYYVNDAGRQMDILATSVWLRYLSLVDNTDDNIDFPTNAYQGDYIWDIASDLHRKYAELFDINLNELYKNIYPDQIDDSDNNGDKERHIDDLIAKAKLYLGNHYQTIFDMASATIIANIKQDLSNFGLQFDEWFSEKSLSVEVDDLIKTLKNNGDIYQKEGNEWFKSSDYDDEKDRVVVRSNGLKTYFSSDIAYHKNKIDRNFDTLINIWGADHHGYIARIKAGMTALQLDSDKLTVLLVQFAKLFRGTTPIKMSTRSGSFVGLSELYQEVGVDATRFFYVARKPEQHLDFDLQLAKSKNSENPVYYIQYAHARVYQVMKKLADNDFSWHKDFGLENTHLLTSDIEMTIIKKLNQYNDMLATAGKKYAVHQIATYLRELAHHFHGFYNTHKFIVDESKLRNARICLIQAVAQTLKNGLSILGVSAPENM